MSGTNACALYRQAGSPRRALHTLKQCMHIRHSLSLEAVSANQRVSSRRKQLCATALNSQTQTSDRRTHLSGGQGHAAAEQRCRVRAGTGAGSLDADQQGTPDSVAEALREAQRALRQAQTELADVESLPSSRLPRQTPRALLLLGKVLQYAVVIGAVLGSQAASPAVQVAAAVAVGAVMGFWGYRKGSLSKSGAVAAALVGASTLGSSFRFGATLLAFYVCSSKLTQLAEDLKDVDEDFKKGGQRDWKQVFCNALIPSVIALYFGLQTALTDVPLSSQLLRSATAAMGAFLGYFACCCGDTWASELGQLSNQQPRLITSLRPVRKGTNGGVTLLGLAASAGGGLFMGVIFYTAALVSPTLSGIPGALQLAADQWRLIPLGLAGGLLGSLLDSFLGATVQFTGYNRRTGRVSSRLTEDVVPISGLPILDNNLVNLVSASSTAVATCWAALHLF